MADNDHDLSTWKAAVSPTDDCLSMQQLERCAASEVPLDAKTADHLSKCAHCQTELAMLKSFESATPAANEGAAVSWIVAQLGRKSEKSAFSFGGKLAWLRRGFMKSPQLIAVMAVAVVAIFSGSLYIFDHSAEPPLSKGIHGPDVMRSGAIRLIEPSGDVSQKPAEFKWEAYAGASSYSVEIREVNNEVVWAGKAESNFVVVGPQGKAAIPFGKQLLWKVTALDSAGNPLADSSRGSFRVLKTED